MIFNVYYLNSHFDLVNFVLNQHESSNFIELNYVFPKDNILRFPKNKRNLIVIQVESLETSYQSKTKGGLFEKNYIPELTRLAENNISFSENNYEKGAKVLADCSWTIAGIVCETAGIPLKIPVDGNTMNLYRDFLPGVMTLGDILEKQGYENYFFLGTDKKFAGQENYFSQHGHYKIYDKSEINKDEEYIKDVNLFNFVLINFEKIIKKNKPFHIFIQTYDTHFGSSENFLNLSKNLHDFLDELKVLKILDNTTVVIIGDHLNMNNSNFKKENFKERRVYNVFINSSVKASKLKNRKFSTQDFFPTILASIGIKIKGNKLGLGTNLFSKEDTLLEKYDESFVNKEIEKNSLFYKKYFLRK